MKLKKCSDEKMLARINQQSANKSAIKTSMIARIIYYMYFGHKIKVFFIPEISTEQIFQEHIMIQNL